MTNFFRDRDRALISVGWYKFRKLIILYSVSKKFAEITNMPIPSKRARIYKTIYLNYAMVWNVLYSLRLFSIFSRGRLNVADRSRMCVYLFSFFVYKLLLNLYLSEKIFPNRPDFFACLGRCALGRYCFVWENFLLRDRDRVYPGFENFEKMPILALRRL